MESTIYLMGPRGAGKTTVGKAFSIFRLSIYCYEQFR